MKEQTPFLHFTMTHVPGSVLVRASDTDVMVILVSMLDRYLLEGRSLKSILMDCGAENKHRYAV